MKEKLETINRKLKTELKSCFIFYCLNQNLFKARENHNKIILSLIDKSIPLGYQGNGVGLLNQYQNFRIFV